MTIERVRPPMLPGPRDVQPLWPGSRPAVSRIKAPGSTRGPVGTPAIWALGWLRDRMLSSCRKARGNASGGTTPSSFRLWSSR